MARILIIDDQPEFLEIFSVKLQSAGFEIQTAQNGEAGVARAKEMHPDLILLDMEMPGMDGAQVLGKIKDDPASRDCKVVFLSNLGRPEPEQQAMNDRISKEAGALGYVKKTADLDLLVKEVHRFLGN